MADPGIGLRQDGGITTSSCLASLSELVAGVGVPVLVGTSRKTFIGRSSPTRRRARTATDERDDGTLATVVWAVERGASVVRVHDAGPAADAVRLLDVMWAIDAAAVTREGPVGAGARAPRVLLDHQGPAGGLGAARAASPATTARCAARRS